VLRFEGSLKTAPDADSDDYSTSPPGRHGDRRGEK
jgi:hypothetical protein